MIRKLSTYLLLILSPLGLAAQYISEVLEYVPAPGQFIQLGVPESGRFFLRRPFSVFGCTKDTLDLLIVEAGEGTKITVKDGKIVEMPSLKNNGTYSSFRIIEVDYFETD